MTNANDNIVDVNNANGLVNIHEYVMHRILSTHANTVQKSSI